MDTLTIPREFLNRKGRRAEVAIARKEPELERLFSAQRHNDHQRDTRADGLAYRIAYRIAQVKRDIPAIKAFQKKHPKLRKQFKLTNKKLGI